MAPRRYLVFIGASGALSDELSKLKRGPNPLTIIAPAGKKKQLGITEGTVARALENLITELKKGQDYQELAKLSVWAFEPASPEKFDIIWNTFGKAGWVEIIPNSLIFKVKMARKFIEDRITEVDSLIHETANFVYNKRATSPFPIPLKNFHSTHTIRLLERWYHRKNKDSLIKLMTDYKRTFRNEHWDKQRAHCDDHKVLFSPADIHTYHGVPHPAGAYDICYVNGRFRFGATLFPGFHYEVSKKKGNLRGNFWDCRGTVRNLSSENRTYINIFPNDHLLPEKKAEK